MRVCYWNKARMIIAISLANELSNEKKNTIDTYLPSTYKKIITEKRGIKKTKVGNT